MRGHFELSNERFGGDFEAMTARDFDIADKIVHVSASGERTVIKDKRASVPRPDPLRVAVEAYGSTQLKSKSDGILQDMDSLGRALGGPPLTEALEQSLCATCGHKVDPGHDFKDRPSREEWDISHMCQSCQDVAFAEPEE